MGPFLVAYVSRLFRKTWNWIRGGKPWPTWFLPIGRGAKVKCSKMLIQIRLNKDVYIYIYICVYKLIMRGALTGGP